MGIIIKNVGMTAEQKAMMDELFRILEKAKTGNQTFDEEEAIEEMKLGKEAASLEWLYERYANILHGAIYVCNRRVEDKPFGIEVSSENWKEYADKIEEFVELYDVCYHAFFEGEVSMEEFLKLCFVRNGMKIIRLVKDVRIW